MNSFLMRVLLCSTNEQLRAQLDDPQLGRQLLLLPISDADTVFDTPGEPGAITARPWVCIDDDNWAVAWETVALLVPASSLSEEERRRLRRALVRASATITTLAVAPEALTLLSADMETSEDEILLPITVEYARSTLRTSADLNQRLTSYPRLLLLEGNVCVEYDTSTRRLAVRGSGSALIFTATAGEPKTLAPIRLDVLADGMSQQW